MQHRLSVAVFSSLVVAVAVLFWWQASTEVPAPTGVSDTPATTSQPAAAPDAASAAAVGSAQRVADSAAGSTAVAEGGKAELPAGRVRQLRGRVVDPGGAPVVGAVVQVPRGVEADVLRLGAAGGPGAGWRDFDPTQWEERIARARSVATEATTTADGAFRIEVEATSQRLVLIARARGYQVLDHMVRFDATSGMQEFVDVGTLTLRLGAVVRGRVVLASQVPLGGAMVTAEARTRVDAAVAEGLRAPDLDGFAPWAPAGDAIAGAGVATDEDGSFELLHVPPGPLTLRVRHPEHPSARRDDLEVQPGGTLLDVLVTVEVGVAIRGRVVGAPSGAKLRAIAVAAERSVPGDLGGPGAEGAGPWLAELGEMAAQFGLGSERTVAVATDGSFVLAGLRRGRTYRVAATQGGPGPNGSASCTARVDVVPPFDGLELRYEPGVVVRLRAVDAVTEAPIEVLAVDDRLRGGSGMEAVLAMAPREARQRDYPGGVVVLAGLRPKPGQTLSIGITALGYAPLQRDDIVLPGQGELDLGVLRLSPAAMVEVVVAAAATGQPVAGARVVVRAVQPAAEFSLEQMVAVAQRDRGAGRTDAAGRFVANVPPPAADSPGFEVQVQARDFAPYVSATMPRVASGTVQHLVSLAVGGQVVVRVIDAAGAPLASARLEHAPPQGARSIRTTGQEGTATFTHLVAGEHRFRLAVRGDSAEIVARLVPARTDTTPATGLGWSAATVVDGQTVSLELRQDPLATLVGFVRQAGQPVVGARVQFVTGDGAANAEEGGLAERFAEVAADRGRERRSIRTGADGAYELRSLPTGSHRLRVTVSGRAMPMLVPVVLVAGANVVDVVLDDSVARGVVRGPDGAPVAGASITVAIDRPQPASSDPLTAAVEGTLPGGVGAFTGGGSRVVKTDAEGRFELRGLQAGQRLRVRATARGFAAAASQAFQLDGSGAVPELEVRLLAAGKVKVTSPGAGPLVSVRARLLGADGQPDPAVVPVVQLLQRGSGTLQGLQPGTWQLELVEVLGGGRPRGEVGTNAGRTVVVTAGATVEVSL